MTISTRSLSVINEGKEITITGP